MAAAATARPVSSRPPRLAVVTTSLAAVVAVLASLNLYLLEDNNALTPAIYSASPLLRVSYAAAYLSALVSMVGVVAIVAYALLRARGMGTISVIVVAALVALAGFGGLLARQPLSFFTLLLSYGALAAICLLVGRAVANRALPRLSTPSSEVAGACAGTAVALLVNLVAIATHTIALNPVSHELFMQGLIGNTHFSSLLIALGLDALTFLICLLSVALLLRAATRAS
jgi:hypothetical protein